MQLSVRLGQLSLCFGLGSFWFFKGRPELNGKEGAIGEFNEAKGRFPVHLETGESVLIKMMNLVAIGDDM